jgi:hypothetical protein
VSIENHKHKNLHTFSSNTVGVLTFSELINNSRTRPNFIGMKKCQKQAEKQRNDNILGYNVAILNGFIDFKMKIVLKLLWI